MVTVRCGGMPRHAFESYFARSDLNLFFRPEGPVQLSAQGIALGKSDVNFFALKGQRSSEVIVAALPLQGEGDIALIFPGRCPISVNLIGAITQ